MADVAIFFFAPSLPSTNGVDVERPAWTQIRHFVMAITTKSDGVVT